MYLTLMNCTLKMVKMVIFVICILPQLIIKIKRWQQHTAKLYFWFSCSGAQKFGLTQSTHKAERWCWLGCILIWRLWEKNPTSNTYRLLAFVGLRSLFPCWWLTGSHCRLPEAACRSPSWGILLPSRGVKSFSHFPSLWLPFCDQQEKLCF